MEAKESPCRNCVFRNAAGRIFIFPSVTWPGGRTGLSSLGFGGGGFLVCALFRLLLALLFLVMFLVFGFGEVRMSSRWLGSGSLRHQRRAGEECSKESQYQFFHKL